MPLFFFVSIENAWQSLPTLIAGKTKIRYICDKPIIFFLE